jgi:Tfp pilus assembly protein PilO
MKLTKTSWIFLIAGVLIIAAVGLGMTRSQQADQKQQFEQQLLQAKKKLALIKTDDLVAQKDQLTVQIAVYNSQLNSAEAKLYSSEDSISATGDILSTAADCGVDIVTIGESEQSSESLAKTQFNAIPLNIQVQGDFDTIRDFVLALTKTFPTSAAKVVQENSNPVAATDGSTQDSAAVAAPSASPEATPLSSPTPTPVASLAPTPAPITPKPVTATISLVIYSYGGK